jgi:hypothetical protein
VGDTVNTWNFLVPAAWTTTGPLVVQINVSGALDCCTSNNSVNVYLNFENLPTLALRLVPIVVDGKRGGITFNRFGPDPFTMSHAVRYVNQVYPQPVTTRARGAFAPSEIVIGPDTNILDMLEKMARIGDNPLWRKTDLLLGVFEPGKHNISESLNGLAHLGRRAAYVTSAVQGSWAHEIGHTVGLPHASRNHGESAGCAHGITWCNYPLWHAQLDAWGTQFDEVAMRFLLYQPGPTAHVKPTLDFDGTHLGRPGDHAFHDFMSYGSQVGRYADRQMRWASLFSYLLLRSHFGIDGWSQNDRVNHRSRRPRQASSTVGPALLVRGTIDPPALKPVYFGFAPEAPADHIIEPVPRTVPYPDVYTIEARDVLDNTLFVQHFHPLIALGPGIATQSFDEWVPWADGRVHRLRLLKGGDVLAEVGGGLLPNPGVDILAPRNGDVWPAGTVQTIRWSVTNSGGRPVFARVSYTPDDGVTWHALATDVEGDSLEVNVDDLMASTTGGGIQVLVNRADVYSFGSGNEVLGLTVAPKPPKPEIIQPGDTNFVAAELPLTFKGAASDPEEEIGDTQLVWTSDRDGVLGTGETLARSLSVGQHIITLTATDSDGLSGEVSVRINVVPPAMTHFLLLPESEKALKCQRRLARRVARLVKRTIGCSRSGLRGILKGEETHIGECQGRAALRFEKGLRRGLRGCPACAALKARLLISPIQAFATEVTGLMMCEEASGPTDVRCQGRGLRDLSAFVRQLVDCHVAAAELGVSSGSFDDAQCHAAQSAFLAAQLSGLSGCPTCFATHRDRSTFLRLAELLADASINQAVFCEGRQPS